jgi:hypothetical protein
MYNLFPVLPTQSSSPGNPSSPPFFNEMFNWLERCVKEQSGVTSLRGSLLRGSAYNVSNKDKVKTTDHVYMDVTL